MKAACASFLLSVSLHALGTTAQYVPLREYAGSTFFDGWDYYGSFDNTTWGNVTYLDQPDAVQQRLTYVNDAGRAIIKVDNSTNVADGPLVYRNSVRITSRDTYTVGNLIVIDLLHLPYGCSVWPSFWTLGQGEEWPDAGEIDIIEGINLMENNQMALHTLPGCMQADSPLQTGRTLETNCSVDRGCIVAETKPNSFGSGFAQAGGGVFAVQMADTGVFMWFWSRPDIPDSIKNANSSSSMDTTTWGTPSAAYPSTTCNLSEFFAPQQLILLITLCGIWAGVPSLYSSTCQTPKNSCYADNIIGPGSPTYDNAYFEINYIRTYIGNTLIPPASPGPTSTTIIRTVSSTVFPTPSVASETTNAAHSMIALDHAAGLFAILAFFLVL